MNFFSRFIRGGERRLNPQTVTYREALSFFEDRRDQYLEAAVLLARLVTPEDDFIDVGANIGFFAHEYMKAVSFQGEAHLFEPVPNLARLCSATFAELPYRVTVHPFALGNSEGSFPIYTADDGNIGWNTFVAGKASGGMKQVTVQTRRFDALGIDLSGVGAIKIDVEGGEFRVLRGMLPALQQSRRLPVLLVEVGWGKSHPNWSDELEIFSELALLGYRSLDPDGSAVEVAGIEGTRDVLFLPERLKETFGVP